MQDFVRSILDDFKLEGLEPQAVNDVQSSNLSTADSSDAEIEWFKDLLNRASSFASEHSSQGLVISNPGLNNA